MNNLETRPAKPQDGWPVSHLNAGSAAFTEVLATPGANQSHYVEGFILTGGATADGFSFIRRSCVVLNSATDTITITDDVALNPVAGDFSIVIGLKIPKTITAMPALLDKYKAASTDGYLLTLVAGKLVFLMADTDGDDATITSDTEVNDGLWHQVVISCDRDSTTGLNIYVDGKAAATAVTPVACDGSITGDGDNLVLTGVATYAMYLSTLAIYKAKALSAAEVTTLWADGAGSKFTGSETGMSACWNTDEGVGEILDLVGSNDGTGANVTWEDGQGLPIDPHTLKKVGSFGTGVIVTSGGLPGTAVTFPHAIKIGRNNPIRIEETDGAFNLVLFGRTDGV